uniref:Uncharacterized protein n=1 Tax=Aegilops tauschii subsp. strangulata TaxID=200361 RepID=A0A453RJA0_AEGTS
ARVRVLRGNLPGMRSGRVPGRGGGGGGGGETAALLCGLLLLLGAADAQGIRRPSSYKTLRGNTPDSPFSRFLDARAPLCPVSCSCVCSC